MGRPKELTDVERADLLARGFRPVEVWVPDWNDPAFVAAVEEECRAIRESDRRTHMDETLDAFLADAWADFD
ncbi:MULTISPECIES: antitoxin MazE-like protein [unclassified Aureimonas]|uniref:antitoxin MazE-like protein n=1 Tax=unclassified Aureimonas TaxID=2615206 RepID=UPI0006FEABFB|nr:MULTISPECIES: antitoxin MazE-like protein [unclassified Aureimonas]KQT66254.1 hypothetical protein ASG62_19700 [Aureimonas sp. Leaf427]KQT72443.1 hypothetical protein ASG54_04070 [Aureimonas sp. Leaf460]